ncbi:hypothetical protein [Variovorax paradoxus]|uniref:Uncharacterized protein n=1 Tax=Variovorax paradoxus TaxID=34073 RepID=A0A679JHU5_VARPD|nr:hypothetical protein VVAX_06421 [Variovorax paradoxus]
MAHASSSTAPRRPAPQFRPFEWIEGDGLDASLRSQAEFLNDARDVVQGVQTLSQLLAWDEDRQEAALSDADPAPLFDAAQRSALQRLVCAALGLLHARIESRCEALTG